MNQLAEIRGRFKRLATRGSGVVVTLWGEAGIGKSHAARTILRDSHVLYRTVHASLAPSALTALLPRPRKLSAWVEPLLERLERGEYLPEETALGAICALLSKLAPFVLHVEDLHEAAPERARWWTGLGQGIVRLRGVGLLLTSRAESLGQLSVSDVLSLRLEPLALPETQAMLEAEVGAPLPGEAVAWIQRRAAGNPLFALEFFRHLARQGFAWNDARRWHWRAPPEATLPVNVEALIERVLLDGADTPELETALAAAALLADGASPELQAAVAGTTPEVFLLLSARLRAAGVFALSGFVHPLYREVARARIAAADIREYARRAIAWLGPTAPERATEFIDLAQLEPRAACALFDASIRQARAQGHEVEAARLLRRSLPYQNEAERPRVALEALRVLHDTDFAIASELLEIALAAAALSAPETAFLSEQLAQRGREAEALHLLQTLDESARTTAQLLEWRARFAILAGNAGAALDLVGAHPELLQTQQPELLPQLVQLLATTGRSEAALQTGLRGLELKLTPPQRVALLPATATAFFHQGRYDEAIRLWSQAIELALTNQMGTAAMKLTISRAQALIRTGEKARAEADLERGSKLAREFGDRRIYLQSLVLLGVVLTERGAFEAAEETLLEGLSVFPEGIFPELRFNAEMALTELYRVWGSAHAPILMHKYARRVFQQARDLSNPVLWLNAHLALSAAELRVGQARRALELADEALALGQGHGRPFQTMSALRCRAAALEGLHDQTGALESWRAAMTAAETLQLPLLVQECRLETCRLTHDLSGARACLAWFEVNNHPLEAANARRYFPVLEAHPTPLESPAALKLEVLGPLQITGDPPPKDQPRAIRGRKRQELLAALMEARIAGRSEITRLELLDALYPDEAADRATSSLKELVRGTRASLGAATIQTGANGYALGAITSDAEQFLETGETALWRGAYLNGLTSTDDAVRESLHLALSLQAEARLETDPKEAARIGRLLLEYDPYNLAYLRLTLTALRAGDNYKALTRVYTEARDRMLEVGEALPERWQDFAVTA